MYGDHRDLHVLTHSFPTRRSSDLRKMLVSAAAIDREQRLAGFLVDHRGRIGKLELVLPAALATEIDVDVAVHEVVTVVQGRRVLIGQGGPVMHIERR